MTRSDTKLRSTVGADDIRMTCKVQRLGLSPQAVTLLANRARAYGAEKGNELGPDRLLSRDAVTEYLAV